MRVLENDVISLFSWRIIRYDSCLWSDVFSTYTVDKSVSCVILWFLPKWIVHASNILKRLGNGLRPFCTNKSSWAGIVKMCVRVECDRGSSVSRTIVRWRFLAEVPWTNRTTAVGVLNNDSWLFIVLIPINSFWTFIYHDGAWPVLPSPSYLPTDSQCSHYRNRNRNLKTSKAPLKSEAHQGTSLFTSAATNQRGVPKGGQEKLRSEFQSTRRGQSSC